MRRAIPPLGYKHDVTLSGAMEQYLEWRAASAGASRGSIEQYRRTYRTFTASSGQRAE
jgi:hypothetical protein